MHYDLLQKLDKTWLEPLGGEFDKPYMKALVSFLEEQKKSGKVIYPAETDIFNAFTETPFPDVKVVILGQDPYHGEGQAHGLSFSVREGIRFPPSLRNIFKEIMMEYEASMMPTNGNLSGWARQGVLLLNATLTVEDGKAASHQGKGWEEFTDEVIAAVSDKLEHVVFILWGSYAQKKGRIIDRTRHLVLDGPHPSPLSAHRGFFGCMHFRKANEYLIKHHRAPIDWLDLERS